MEQMQPRRRCGACHARSAVLLSFLSALEQHFFYWFHYTVVGIFDESEPQTASDPHSARGPGRKQVRIGNALSDFYLSKPEGGGLSPSLSTSLISDPEELASCGRLPGSIRSHVCTQQKWTDREARCLSGHQLPGFLVGE